MTKDILFLLIALTALLIILTSTIKEVLDILHAYYSSAAHPGRIRGASGAHPGRIRGASKPGPEDYVRLDLKPEELRVVKMIIDKGRFIDDLK